MAGLDYAMQLPGHVMDTLAAAISSKPSSHPVRHDVSAAAPTTQGPLPFPDQASTDGGFQFFLSESGSTFADHILTNPFINGDSFIVFGAFASGECPGYGY